MRLKGRHYRTGLPLELVCEGGTIAAVQRPGGSSPIDLEARWIAPAFFDLQINGCGGFSFNSPELDLGQVRHVVAVCQSHGISQFFPTLITAPPEALLHGCQTLRQACESEAALSHALPGLHLEGPFISPVEGPRGAHPRAHVRPPDWDEFLRLQDAAGGRIRLVTLAPELPGALGFIEKLTEAGVVVGLGHTAASGPILRDAVRAGARLSTHLGNGAHALLPRHDNYLWEQLANDELWASVIADGHHLPDTLLRCFLRIKSPARLILSCVAGSLAGVPAGRYQQWDQDMDVTADGRIVLPGTSYLAGSWAFTDQLVRRMVHLGEITLADAVDLASARPRQLMNLVPRRLQVGEPAELILFEGQTGGDFELTATVIGERVLPPARST